jgi:ATP-binding cassette subfamily B protein
MSTTYASAEFTQQTTQTFERSSLTLWFFSHIKPYWWIVVIIFLGALGNAALAALIPALTGNAFNAMFSSPPVTSALLPLALGIVVSQLSRGVLQLARNFSSELLAQKMERDVREELYLSLLGKSMTFHNLQPVGDTMARATNDVREVGYIFSPAGNQAIGSFMFIFMPIIFAARYHPTLIATPVVFIFIYIFALSRYLKRLSPATDTVRHLFGEMNSLLSESLDGIEVMKGAAQETAEVGRFAMNTKKVRNAFVTQGDIEAGYIANLLLGVVYAIGLVHALFLFRAGQINVGAVVGYFGMLQLLGFPTFTSQFAYSQISSGLSSARRVFELIKRETMLDQNATGRISEIRGEVEFRNVSFRYPRLSLHSPGETDENDNDAASVLSNISFKVKPGQTVALVGQTGAGKTTLVKLINRIHDVTSGQVLVDGVDVRDWNLASLREQISIIEQDIFLFSRSLSDNIAFGKPGATKDEIMSASIAAQAHDFILDFEDSYATAVGERGVTLSGGQRQRIALARAFLTDPRVLVLDDSTSAIDSATEDKIQRAISNASRGRTTFIITHRLSQIRWADLIIVLRKGQIAAIGTHDDLMKTSEAYSRIFRD